jgi:tetratricopeptide (TPR) repeat protein
VRRRQGDLDGALQDHTEAIRLNPGEANAYYNRAVVWKQKGNHSAAIRDYESYLRLGGGARDGDEAQVRRIIDDLRKNADG